MTPPSCAAVCDDDAIKYGGEGDALTAPQKWMGAGKGPWTVEEDAILRRIRKQYDAQIFRGNCTSSVGFAGRRAHTRSVLCSQQ